MTYQLHDRDIREPLFEWFECNFGKIRIIEEKVIGRSRADAFIVTPRFLFGMEIKGDADTYERLAVQTRNYDRYFDANLVVVGRSHVHVSEHVPSWWGIVVTDRDGHGGLDVGFSRLPGRSPKTSRRRKLSILWRPELAHIQELNGMPRYAGKSKKFVEDKILEQVDAGLLDGPTLDRQICDELFERDYTLIEGQIAEYRAAHGR